MPGPLDGVRVLDLTHVLNGPYATMLLGHLGAEIIKIETRQGDHFRSVWMPPGVQRDGYEFLVVNSNKKGITLDLKVERGKELFRRLVELSDVMVENFSLGVMDRLGLGYETLKAVNPGLIYASSRGYGDSGPNACCRANALTNNAVAGWQSSAWQASGHYGTKVLGIGDEAGGISLALGIIAALFAREKKGLSQKIEISMQESLLGFMVSSFHTYFEGVSPGISPKQAADGYYAFRLPAISNETWTRLCIAMGRNDLREESRFATPRERQKHSKELDEIIGKWVREKTRTELWRILTELGLANAPVLTMDEVMKDPHLQARKAFVKVHHPTAGEVTLLAPWIRMSETPSSINSPAPLIGQHNEEIYCGLLGLDRKELDALIKDGVV